MNERYFRKVALYSYYPACRMFLDLVRQGMHLSIGFSLSFIRQAALWDMQLLDLFRELVAHENVELIGVEPYHSFLFLLDLPAFVVRMRKMAEELEQIFGKRPVVTDTTEMCMSKGLYQALDTAGFRGALLDGRPWVMEWRESTHLYNSNDNVPYARPFEEKKSGRRTRKKVSKLIDGTPSSEGPYLLTRHLELSDDVGYRFSNRSWHGYPLYADTYANWIAHSGGDMMLLGWDFETFGEHHRQDSGIFEFMRALPAELAGRKVETYTASQLIERHRVHAYQLPLPIEPTTWAGSGGMEFFLGNSAQQNILQLMNHVYNMARLTEDLDLIDLAVWLTQSDNLHFDSVVWEKWARGRSLGIFYARQSGGSWGHNGVIQEQQQVYVNALRAMEPYLPVKALRRATRKSEKSSANLLEGARELAFASS